MEKVRLVRQKLGISSIFKIHLIITLKNFFKKQSCIAMVKSYQNYHMDSNGWADIGYNFIVGEDGNIYEGIFLLKSFNTRKKNYK